MKRILFILIFLLGFVPLQAFAAATTTPVVNHTSDIPEQLLDSDGDGYSDALELQDGFDPFSTSTVSLQKTISVSLKDQRLRYYTGKYLVKEINISSGLRGTPTPVGTFTIEKKKLLVHYKGEGYDFPNTKWNMQFKYHIKGSYFIHGAFWHKRFGHPASHGCVNVSYADMEPLYRWTPTSTPVFIK